jgi:hypothetical protein
MLEQVLQQRNGRPTREAGAAISSKDFADAQRAAAKPATATEHTVHSNKRGANLVDDRARWRRRGFSFVPLKERPPTLCLRGGHKVSGRLHESRRSRSRSMRSRRIDCGSSRPSTRYARHDGGAHDQFGAADVLESTNAPQPLGSSRLLGGGEAPEIPARRRAGVFFPLQKRNGRPVHCIGGKLRAAKFMHEVGRG